MFLMEKLIKLHWVGLICQFNAYILMKINLFVEIEMEICKFV